MLEMKGDAQGNRSRNCGRLAFRFRKLIARNMADLKRERLPPASRLLQDRERGVAMV
jgi:hypothetical protein